MATIAIQAERLSKCFELRHNREGELKVRFLALFDPRRRERIEEFWAVRDASFEIHRGEAVGIVGRNGSGKSTLLKLVAGLHRPTSGHLRLDRHSRIGTMIELGVGFHHELSGRENVFLNASIYGLRRSEMEALYPAIVAYSGLEHFMDTPLKNYSSGMHMRLGFAVAANLDPDLLLLDEIFAVGDADFQRQCLATLEGYRKKDKTILFVSHAPDAVRAVCDRVIVIDRGRIRFDGPTEEGLAFYEEMLAGAAAAGGVSL